MEGNLGCSGNLDNKKQKRDSLKPKSKINSFTFKRKEHTALISNHSKDSERPRK